MIIVLQIFISVGSFKLSEDVSGTGQPGYLHYDAPNIKLSSKLMLNRDRRLHHIEGQDRRYNCQLCSYSTDSSSNIKYHSLTHTGERPHKCSYCGRGFALKRNLQTHEFIHTGQRPFFCEICNKTFRQRNHLVKHRIIHFKQLPHSANMH